MLRLLGFIIKVCLFSLTVVILSNWVHWKGRTISDQVQTQLSHAERSPWMGKLPAGIRDWVEKNTPPLPRKNRRGETTSSYRGNNNSVALRPQAELASDDARTGRTAVGDAATSEALPSSERQKLKALIRELNSSRGQD